ncbi:MAG: hypothetical protein WA030_01830 [Candidatus Microsaccharimonas sp.]
MTNRTTLITAAGGNGTAIQIISQPLDRATYEKRGKELGDAMEGDGAEQAGFLVLDDNHFEMAGGEFCGNASRAAAMLFSEASGQKDVSFTVSGFDGTVTAYVDRRSPTKAFVRCTFAGMPVDVSDVILADGRKAEIVDLGGIVHVVIEGPFINDEAWYSPQHRAITEKFNLGERDAVGVIWFEKNQDTVLIHPVVWVKAVDTFYYESSCGSGTIAVGRVTNAPSIIQPSGGTITAGINQSTVVLESEMEVIR